METIKCNKIRLIIGSLLIVYAFTTSYSQIHSPFNIGYNLPDSIYKPNDILKVWEDPDNYENTDEITFYEYEVLEEFAWPPGYPIPPELFRPIIFKNIYYFDNNKNLQRKEGYSFDHDNKEYHIIQETNYEYNDLGKRTYINTKSIEGEDVEFIGLIDFTQKNEYDENGNLLLESREFHYNTDDPSRYDTVKYEYSYDADNDLIIQKQLFLNRTFPTNIYRLFNNDTVIYHGKSELSAYNDSIDTFDSLEYITKIDFSEYNDTITTTSYVLDTNSIEPKYNLHSKIIHSYYDNNNDSIFITDVRWDANSSGTLIPTPTYHKLRIYKNGKFIYSLEKVILGNSVSTSCNNENCTTTFGMAENIIESIHYYDENGIWQSSQITFTTITPNQEDSGSRYYCRVLPDDILKTTINSSNQGNVNSINQTICNSFSLYPNPARDVLNIEMQQTLDMGEIQITSISGRLIEQVPLYKQSKITIDVSQYKKGIYFISVKGISENYTEKIAIY